MERRRRFCPITQFGDTPCRETEKKLPLLCRIRAAIQTCGLPQPAVVRPRVRIFSAAVEDSPFFLPDGDLIFRAIEGGSNFLYRMKADGTGRRKITSERILDIESVSPDGRWVVAGAPRPDEEYTAAAKAFAVDGGASVPLCIGYCMLNWDTAGKYTFVSFFADGAGGSYVTPVMHNLGLPKLPPAGLARQDLTNAKTTLALPWFVQSAISPSVYAYTRETTRRNLYRISLP